MCSFKKTYDRIDARLSARQQKILIILLLLIFKNFSSALKTRSFSSSVGGIFDASMPKIALPSSYSSVNIGSEHALNISENQLLRTDSHNPFFAVNTFASPWFFR